MLCQTFETSFHHGQRATVSPRRTYCTLSPQHKSESPLTTRRPWLTCLLMVLLSGCHSIPPRRDEQFEHQLLDQSVPVNFVAPRGFGPLRWGMNSQDVIDEVGLLEPTFGELWTDRPFHLVAQIPEPPPGAPPITYEDPIFPAGTTAEMVWDDKPRISSDAFYSLAEYRPLEPNQAQLSLDESDALGTKVQVFYLFSAIHEAPVGPHPNRRFSRDDLTFSGVRLMFTVDNTPNGREPILAWLVQRYGAPLYYHDPTAAPVTDRSELATANSTLPESAATDSERTDLVKSTAASTATPIRDGVFRSGSQEFALTAEQTVPEHSMLNLEQYRWCGPSRYNEGTISCPAAVTYVFDRTSHRGVVFILDRSAYHYFVMRIHRTSLGPQMLKRDRYYGLLFANPEHYVGNETPVICAGCGPDSFPLDATVRVLFQFIPEEDEP